jgi:hypothetical protein
MKMIGKAVRRSRANSLLALLLLFTVMAPGATAKDKPEKPRDSLAVVAHLPLPGAPVSRTFLQEHGGKQYLYIQQASVQGFLVVDVTKPYRPEVVNRVTFTNYIPGEKLQMVGAGLAIAQASDSQMESARHQLTAGRGEGTLGGGTDRPTRFVSLLDMSNPASPRILQTFDGVTSILPDDSRNLIYLTNSGGLWILHHRENLARQICDSESAFSEMANCYAY